MSDNASIKRTCQNQFTSKSRIKTRKNHEVHQRQRETMQPVCQYPNFPTLFSFFFAPHTHNFYSSFHLPKKNTVDSILLSMKKEFILINYFKYLINIFLISLIRIISGSATNFFYFDPLYLTQTYCKKNTVIFLTNYRISIIYTLQFLLNLFMNVFNF